MTLLLGESANEAELPVDWWGEAATGAGAVILAGFFFFFLERNPFVTSNHFPAKK